MNGRALCFAAEYCAGASEVILSLSAAPVVLMLWMIATFASQSVCPGQLTETHTHAKPLHYRQMQMFFQEIKNSIRDLYYFKSRQMTQCKFSCIVLSFSV